MRVSALCGRLLKCFSGFYSTGVRRQRTLQLCGIRIKSFGTLFVSAPLCGDSDLCDPDRNQGDVETVYGEGAEAEGEVVELWNVVFGVVWSSS